MKVSLPATHQGGEVGICMSTLTKAAFSMHRACFMLRAGISYLGYCTQRTNSVQRTLHPEATFLLIRAQSPRVS